MVYHPQVQELKHSSNLFLQDKKQIFTLFFEYKMIGSGY